MTNLEFIRKASYTDLAEYLYPIFSNQYVAFEICGKYADYERCEGDCAACIIGWLYDEKRDDFDTI